MNEACPHFAAARCRSCDLLDRPYSGQLEAKAQAVSAALRQILTADQLEPLPIVGVGRVFGTRGKAKMAVGGSARAPSIGFPGKDFAIIDIIDCPLHAEPLAEILAATRDLIQKYELPPYDIRAKRGELKYVIARRAIGTGEILVRLVLRSTEQISKARAIFTELRAQFPALRVASVNVQPIPMAIVEGPEELVFSDAKTITEQLADTRLIFSPESFSQVTPEVAAQLYLSARSEVQRLGSRKLLDLYCGVGAFSLFCGRVCESVLGVEISSAAIENAKAASRANGLAQVQFQQADAEEFLGGHALDYDTVVVNPPRRGLSPLIIQRLNSSEVRNLLYSSCDPLTLARDLESLAAAFRVAKVQPFDMFPGTSHVETLVSLVRR